MQFKGLKFTCTKVFYVYHRRSFRAARSVANTSQRLYWVRVCSRHGTASGLYVSRKARNERRGFYGFCLKRRGVGVRGAETPYYYYNAYIRIMLLEVENALRTLVKQQVEDAEVGQEAVALRTYLIIRCGVEVGVGQRMLRPNSLAEVDNCIILRWQHDILFRESYFWPHVEQLAHGVHDVEVQVEEEGVSFLEERSQVVGIKLEEGCLAVGRHQGVPVQMSPVAVVRDTNIAHGALRAVVSLDGHGERLRTVGRCNDAAVAVGLLHKMVVLLNDARHAMQLLVPLNGAEVGGAEKGSPTPAPRLRGFPLPVGEGSNVLCCFYFILIFCIFFLLIIHLIINHKDVLNRK